MHNLRLLLGLTLVWAIAAVQGGDAGKDESISNVSKKAKVHRRHRDVREEFVVNDFPSMVDESPERVPSPPPPEPQKKPQEALLRKFPRIHVNDLMHPNNTDYFLLRKPFVLQGAMQGWAAMDMWDPEYFAEYFPEETIDFYPHNMRHSGVHPYLERFETALSELANPTPGRYRDSSAPPNPMKSTYLQWNVPPHKWKEVAPDMGTLPTFFRTDDKWLASCLKSKKTREEFFLRTHWRMILIGNTGAGMFNHIDSIRTGAWQAQVAGVKKWFICGPDQSAYVGPAGAVNVFNPDYEATPQFRKADCIVDTVEPGEVVYYPGDTWHSTMCMTDWTIGVVGTVIEDHNWTWVRDELRAECQRGKYNYRFSPELCHDLENCYDLWEEYFGQ